MRSSFALLLAALVAAAQEPASLAEAVMQLEQALAEKAAPDAQKALARIPALYAKADEEQRKRAVEVVGKAAGSDDLAVRHGAFAALGEMKAKGSSKYLARWLDPPKRFKGEIPPSYIEAIRAAGAIADASMLETLKDLSDHNDLPLAEAATQALGGFHTLPTKRRKALSIELCERLERLAAPPGRRSRGDNFERNARLAAATTAALRGLTGKDYQTLDGWKTWKERAEKQADPFDS